MSSRLFLLVLIMLLYVFSCLGSSLVSCAETSENTVFSTESDVKLAIAAAQERIVVCYQAVADADRVGANTTALLAALNEGGHLLSRANWALEMGDLDSALSLALLSQERLNDFVAEAIVLKETTIQRHYWDFIVNVVGSIVGTLVVICGSFVVWLLLKRGREKAGSARMQYRVLFLTVAGILALLVASPALSRLLISTYARTEFFTELWILDSNHRAEDYPFNITRNHDYSMFLGIGNRLGYCAYYLVEVKFRNQTQSAPDGFNRTTSSLEPLFNITAFVEDEGIWKLPLTFSFDYKYNETFSRVEFYSLTLNAVPLDMRSRHYTAAWDSENEGFFGNLFFELWLYNRTSSSFQYHNRFVSLWLNMTGS